MDVFIENMDLLNCLSSLSFSVKYNETKLEEKSKIFVDEHFGEIIQQKKFNQMNKDDMVAILRMKDNKVSFLYI